MEASPTALPSVTQSGAERSLARLARDGCLAGRKAQAARLPSSSMAVSMSWVLDVVTEDEVVVTQLRLNPGLFNGSGLVPDSVGQDHPESFFRCGAITGNSMTVIPNRPS